MEKPEWFKEVEALEGIPESVVPSRGRIVRLSKGFAYAGVAAVMAVGGYTFAQATNAPSNQALSSASAASSSAAAASSGTTKNTPVAGTAVGGTNLAQAAISGGKPSITGAAAGGEDD